MGRKQKLLAKAQAEGMPLSRAQLIMREDMLGAHLNEVDDDGRFVVKAADIHPTLFDDELDDETPEQHPVFAGNQSAREQQQEAARQAGVAPLRDTLDSLFGVSAPGHLAAEVSSRAEDIIHSGLTLTLSLQQWNVVQGLVEHGIRAGIQMASEVRG